MAGRGRLLLLGAVGGIATIGGLALERYWRDRSRGQKLNDRDDACCMCQKQTSGDSLGVRCSNGHALCDACLRSRLARHAELRRIDETESGGSSGSGLPCPYRGEGGEVCASIPFDSDVLAAVLRLSDVNAIRKRDVSSRAVSPQPTLASDDHTIASPAPYASSSVVVTGVKSIASVVAGVVASAASAATSLLPKTISVRFGGAAATEDAPHLHSLTATDDISTRAHRPPPGEASAVAAAADKLTTSLLCLSHEAEGAALLMSHRAAAPPLSPTAVCKRVQIASLLHAMREVCTASPPPPSLPSGSGSHAAGATGSASTAGAAAPTAAAAAGVIETAGADLLWCGLELAAPSIGRAGIAWDEVWALMPQDLKRHVSPALHTEAFRRVLRAIGHGLREYERRGEQTDAHAAAGSSSSSSSSGCGSEEEDLTIRAPLTSHAHSGLAMEAPATTKVTTITTTSRRVTGGLRTDTRSELESFAAALGYGPLVEEDAEEREEGTTPEGGEGGSETWSEVSPQRQQRQQQGEEGAGACWPLKKDGVA